MATAPPDVHVRVDTSECLELLKELAAISRRVPKVAQEFVQLRDTGVIVQHKKSVASGASVVAFLEPSGRFRDFVAAVRARDRQR